MTDGATGNPCRGKGLVSTTPRDTSRLPTRTRTLLPSRPTAPPPPLVIIVAPLNKPCHVAAPTSIEDSTRSYPQWSVRQAESLLKTEVEDKVLAVLMKAQIMMMEEVMPFE